MTNQTLLIKMMARTEPTIRLSEFCLLWGLDKTEVVSVLGVEDSDALPLITLYALSKLPGDREQHRTKAKQLSPREFVDYAKKHMRLKELA